MVRGHVGVPSEEVPEVQIRMFSRKDTSEGTGRINFTV